MAKVCSIEAVKGGFVTLTDLQEMNAILDLQNDMQEQAMDDVKSNAANKK